MNGRVCCCCAGCMKYVKNVKERSVTMKIRLRTQWERYASVVLSRLESIVAVPSSKGANGVGEEGCRTRGCEGGKVFDLFADILHRRTKVGAMSVKRQHDTSIPFPLSP